MRRWAAYLMLLFGFATLVATVLVTVRGIKTPTPNYSIAIALSGVILAPLGLSAIARGFSIRRPPDAVAAREEATARNRVAIALEDAATAEKIKLEIDAYVELRARRLEIETRRDTLRATAERLVREYDDLKVMESQLGVATSLIDSDALTTLDDILGPERESSVRFPSFYVLGLPVGEYAEDALRRWTRRRERRQMERLAHVNPQGLAVEEFWTEQEQR